MRSSVGSVVVALIGTLGLAACIALPCVTAADALDDRMSAEADSVNRQAPLMVDRFTRLDAAGYANRFFFYHFTAMNHSSTDAPAARQKYAAVMREQATDRACTGSTLRPYLDAGGTVKYVHFGRDHRRIAEVEITAKDCVQRIGGSTPKKAPAKASPRPSAITKGDTYEKVMERLSGSRSTRDVRGESLTAEFTDPSLLAHPDAKGACKLTFNQGVLVRCEGCKPGRFARCGP